MFVWLIGKILTSCIEFPLKCSGNFLETGQTVAFRITPEPAISIK